MQKARLFSRVLPRLPLLWLLCWGLSASRPVWGQVQYAFTNYVGIAGLGGGLDGVVVGARFSNPWDATVDAWGNIYVADYDDSTIRKISPDGTVTTFAGYSGQTGTTDGWTSAARFNHPISIAVDNQGTLYVSDQGNHVIRKIISAGYVMTWAGTAGKAGGADGPLGVAKFNFPAGVAVDTAGNVYVADRSNHAIRKIDPEGVVVTMAGALGYSGAVDGIIFSARFNSPRGIAVDLLWNLYVADTDNHTIRKISPIGEVTTLAGYAGIAGSADGTLAGARFNGPMDVAVDALGTTVYVVERTNHTVRVLQGGQATTLAGEAGIDGSNDGLGVAAHFDQPCGISRDAYGQLYVADTGNYAVRRITPGGEVTTLAGTPGLKGGGAGPGLTAQFQNPAKMALDAAGNLYVADAMNHTIRKVTPAGMTTTLAGKAGETGGDDGNGGLARFNQPSAVEVDANGVLYVADTLNHAIRKITAAGEVSTLAGVAGQSGGADGAGRAAQFNQPAGLAIDSQGRIYVADTANHTIRLVTPDGQVTTLAGMAGQSGNSNGPLATARFNLPTGIAVTSRGFPDGSIYVAEKGSHTIRKISAAGASTLAGVAGSTGNADGPGATARFNQPCDIALDAEGSLFVADAGNHLIRKVTQAAAVSTLGGTAGKTGATNGIGAQALFNNPKGVALAADGSLYVVDSGNHRITKGTPLVFVNWAGLPGTQGNRNGTGNTARFNSPHGVAIDRSNSIYVTDYNNQTLRKISPAGEVTLLAGAPGQKGSVNGMGNDARFNGPDGIAVDRVGNLYVAEFDNHDIRLITPQGLTATLAGGAGQPGNADGPGSAARFYGPAGLALDWMGNLFVADCLNHTIRKIPTNGIVTTLAGVAGQIGSANGTGTNARFNLPAAVAVDVAGNVYVTEYGNHTLRRITPAGVVTTLAGYAGFSGSLDGVGTAARFNGPGGIAVNALGNFYVADSENHVIRMVTAQGAVSTLAGVAGQPGNSDGSGSLARFYSPQDIAVDGAGNVLIADTGNHRITRGTLWEPNTQPMIVTANPLPGAMRLRDYAAPLQAIGGAAPYQWSSSSNLPNGFALSADGILAGNTTQWGLKQVQARVTGSNGYFMEATYVLVITTAPFNITPDSLPGGIQGVPYTVTLNATGGAAPYSWIVSSGALPSGLFLSTDGLINGIPQTTGNTPFTLVISDATDLSMTVDYTLSLSAANPVQLRWAGLTTNGFEFAFTGTPGTSYELQAADRLAVPVEWKPAAVLWLTNGVNRYADPDPLSQTQRYFRLVQRFEPAPENP